MMEGNVQASALTPNDIGVIFDLLGKSLSSDGRVQKESELGLKELENRGNFSSCLLEIVSHKEADRSTRWLASVYMKNMVSRYWRSRLRGAISFDEKQHVRRRLLELLDLEEDNSICVQLTITLSKIGRIDYPKEWPGLFDELVVRTRNASSNLMMKKIFLSIHFLLKELSSKRLSQDQKTFEQLCSGIFGNIWEHFMNSTGQFFGIASNVQELKHSNTMQQCTEILEVSLLQLKCLRRLLVFGFGSDARSLNPVQYVRDSSPILLQLFQNFTQVGSAMRAIVGSEGSLIETTDRCTLKLLKSLHQIQTTHPWCFLHCGSLIPFLDILCEQVSNPILSHGEIGHAFVKQALASILAVLKCPGYRGSTSSLVMTAGQARDQKEHLSKLAEGVKPVLRQFWSTKEANLVIILVSKYFILTKEELILWDSNGEEFHQEAEHSAKEETIRGCAEMVFTALLEGNRQELGHLFLSMMNQVNLSPRVDIQMRSFPAVESVDLQTAAVLHGLAVGAYELHGLLDFGELLQQHILPLISESNRVTLPVRRSALKVVSYWVAEMKPLVRPAVYACLVATLAENDPAIKLMSCAVLQALLEDWDFQTEQFMQFVPQVVNLLAVMLQTFTEYDSQLEVFSLLNLVIDHLGEKTHECAPIILSLIPALWNSSEGQSLLRIQILLALQRLVHVLGKHSPSSYSVVIPVLTTAMNPNHPDSLNLLEDGVLLWIVTLRHAPEADPALLLPLELLLHTMNHSTEHIATGSRCITSCALLYGDIMLEKYGPQISSIFTGYIGSVKDRALLHILPSVDIINQSCPQHGKQVLSRFFAALVVNILGEEESGLVIAASLTSLASLLLQSPEMFMFVFEMTCQSYPNQVEKITNSYQTKKDCISRESSLVDKLLGCFLDLWLDKFDMLGQMASRKLGALGLAQFLPILPLSTLERFGELCSAIVAVWFEIEGPESEPEPMGLSFPVAGVGPRDDCIAVAVDLEEAEGEMVRRRLLFEKGVINCLNLGNHFKQNLSLASQKYGSALDEVMRGVDPSVAGQMNQMLSEQRFHQS